MALYILYGSHTLISVISTYDLMVQVEIGVILWSHI